jgi:hypothetical protein
METVELERDRGGLMVKGSSSASELVVGGMRSGSVVGEVERWWGGSSTGETGVWDCSRVSGNSSSKRFIMPFRVLSRKRRRSR